jgi:hypothetical protein
MLEALLKEHIRYSSVASAQQANDALMMDQSLHSKKAVVGRT